MLLTCWCFLVAPQLARAHQVETVEFEFQKLDRDWRLVGEMDIAYMLPETRKVPGGPPMSRKAVMEASPEELARIHRETEKTLRSILRVTFAGAGIPWTLEFPDFEKDPFALPEEAMDWALLSVRLRIPPQPGPGDLVMHWSGEEESELIVLTEEGDEPRIVNRPKNFIMVRQHDGRHKGERHQQQGDNQHAAAGRLQVPATQRVVAGAVDRRRH